MASGQPQEIRPGLYDWSTLHEPGSEELFQKIKIKSDWSNYRLPQSLVDQFWKDGYISNIPILTPEQCDKVLEDYKYFLDDSNHHPGHDMLYEHHSNQGGDPDNVLMHCLGHWRLTSLFHDLVFHPKVVVPCSQLLVEGQTVPVRFWHDQLFSKPAKHGGVVSWHQDYSFWTRTQPCMHITVHLALDEQTMESGTLQYIDGSHRWLRNGEPLPTVNLANNMEALKSILTEEEKAAFQPKPSLLKKGEATFHSSLSVHGSYQNRSDQPRRAAVLNYFVDGVKSNTNDSMLYQNVNDPTSGSPGVNESLFNGSNIPKGEKMEGQFYPLVYDPSWTQ